jgi:hypothetical protein
MAKAKKKVKAKDVTWLLPVSVEVIADKFGTYKKGDVIAPMFRTTADALVAHKLVKILKDIPNPKKKD